MNNTEEKKEFVCNRCGCCCRNIGNYEPAEYLDRGDGVCKYYDEANRACTIYEFRPDICRVDKMYKDYKNQMSWNEYVDLNYESCEELRKLEKAKGNKVITNEADNNEYINNLLEDEYLFDEDMPN